MKTPLLAIGGSPRTGTTALTDLLNCDRRLFITREYRIFKSWNVPIGPILLKHKLREGRGSAKVFWDRGLDPSKFRNNNEAFTGKDIFEFVVENYKDLVYFGDKLPREYLYRAKKVLKDFPQTKFLFCLRDGRSVIASQIRLFRQKKSKAEFIASSIPEAEGLWLIACDFLREYKKDRRMQDKFMIVKYEESVQDPQTMVNKIGEFLGIGDIDITGHDYKPVHLDAWKRELPGMMKKLSNKFKETLEEFGYPL